MGVSRVARSTAAACGEAGQESGCERVRGHRQRGGGKLQTGDAQMKRWRIFRPAVTGQAAPSGVPGTGPAPGEICAARRGLRRGGFWRHLSHLLRFQLARVIWLKDLYVNRHLDLVLPGAPLESGSGAHFGALNELRLHRGRLYLSGWAEGGQLAVSVGASRVLAVWDGPPLGQRARGFRAQLPFEPGALTVDVFGAARGRLRCYPDVPLGAAEARARARLRRRFWRVFLPRVPGIVRALMLGDKDVTRRLKRDLGLLDADPAPVLDRAWSGQGRVLARPGDPGATDGFSAALDAAQLRAGADEIPVYIAHSLGGGAQAYLDLRLKSDPIALVIRLGGARRFRLELTMPGRRELGETDTPALVGALVHRLATRRIIYSNAGGDPDLAGFPEVLLAFCAGRPLEFLFHDYLAFSPSCTLLDHDAVYRGLPRPDRDDPAHLYRRPDGRIVPLGEWQARWGRVLDRSDRLVAFSDASEALIADARPRLAGRIEVVPHVLPYPVPRLIAPQRRRAVIGVLGAIGQHKGAAVVAALSHQLEANPAIGMAVIGPIAPGFGPARTLPVHGDYALADLPVLAARYGVTHWLIPSVWPETFSYTTHEALATGLPTLAFDLGAQGTAVRAAPNGVLVAWQDAASAPAVLAQRVIAAVVDSLRHLPVVAPAGPWPPLSSVISAAARETIAPSAARLSGSNLADGPDTEMPATGWPVRSKIAAPMHDMPS